MSTPAHTNGHVPTLSTNRAKAIVDAAYHGKYAIAAVCFYNLEAVLATSPDVIRRSADLGGFDGIMVDMSHHEREENLRLSKELVAYCNARGIITECEPGRINGSEDGIADTVDLEEVLTSPEQAERRSLVGSPLAYVAGERPVAISWLPDNTGEERSNCRCWLA
ncbi:hypothetical protein KVT40_006202 [Elsinoe batatas]|uniref:Fructose-bisphosphate aldolase n=1 Tax=Elsinoe batatas TaxID=2601811 RepID=A0A8K0PDK4_9PEZI|nr:hypothetical protein KVT40_006202 [Elsinoe batatas]